MPFSSKDKALIKNLSGSKIQFLENTSRIFKDKLQQGKMGMLLTNIWEIYSTDQKHEASKLKHELKRT